MDPTSVVDPDPNGSGTLPWIWIRIYCSGSGSRKNERADKKIIISNFKPLNSGLCVL